MKPSGMMANSSPFSALKSWTSCKRQFIETNGVVNVLFLINGRGNAKREYAVFSYAAVDGLKVITRLRQGVREIRLAGGSIDRPARRQFPISFFHDTTTFFHIEGFSNVVVA